MDKAEIFMLEALKEAEIAKENGEIPVGAIVVFNDQIIARSHNLREKLNLVRGHAEMIVLEEASKILGTYRLENCDLYVTLEPCPMCAGAILQSHIRNVYFGTFDKKNGAFGGVYNLLENKTLKYKTNVYPCILEEESKKILKEFFEMKR